MTSLTNKKERTNEDYRAFNVKMKAMKKVRKAIVTIIMSLLALLILYPFLLAVGVSVKTPMEALLSPGSLPTELHLENYVEAWKIMSYHTVFANTVFITILGCAGIVFITGLAGYVISWSKSKKFYNFCYIFFLCGLMVPFYTALVPLVKLMSDLHLTNSRWGMILYYWGRNIPMAVFLYVGFIRTVSKEILEASEIDGANTWTTYWKIMFPLMKPITTTIFILDAMHLWNDFLFPRMMLTKSSLRTISLSQYYFTGELGSQYNLAFAAYCLTIVPILILYICMQKNIIKGVASGAVKG